MVWFLRVRTAEYQRFGLGGLLVAREVRGAASVGGNEHRVRVTRHAGFRVWLGPLGPELSFGWVARYAVAVRVLRFAEQERTMSVVVRAVEARALVEKLMPAIRRFGPPEPDTTVLGEEFAGRFDAWIDSLAAAFAQP